MISGSYPHHGFEKTNVKAALFSSGQAPSEAMIRELWELDAIGIRGDSGEKALELESSVLEEFKKGVSFINGRYRVGLPWKSADMKDRLMSNLNAAHKRLKALDKKLSADPELSDRYTKVFIDLESQGIIEEIPNESLSRTDNPIFYLPHRPVVREDSTSTKVRPVFDASAKGENGVSLNDCLEIGPKLTPDLVQILLRFRRWKYGLSADIQKAFLQIEVEPEERDVHRFLIMDTNKQVRHMRFKRVTFGNASSPFMLNAVIKLHLEQYAKDRTILELLTNLYVDDWLTGSDCEGELLRMMAKSEDVLKQGGFPLTKWVSNSQKVSEILQRSLTDHKDEKVQKILGVSWCTEEDCFKFKTMPQVGEVYTKRTLLGLIARQFDPLGLLTPFTVSLKILFQDVWRAGYEWDVILPKQLQGEIEAWVIGLKEVSKWKIPRRLSIGSWSDMKGAELIVFVDASEKAYGSCIYLKSVDNQGIHTSLVAAKVRVAPLKKVTLPRLELLSALLGARLLKFVREALELPSETPYSCFTDSKIAQAWIQGDPCRWKQFVRNRVVEIQNLTNPACWHRCPGKENPADLLTRGIKASLLTTSELWLHGPSEILSETFLQTSDKSEISELEETAMCSVAPCESIFIEYERFSQFEKLLCVTALVLKFIGKLKSKRQAHIDDGGNLRQARNLILKDLQNRSYKQELVDLKRYGTVGKQSSLFTLAPFLDEEGLIRVKGRLSEAPDLTYDEIHPVIIPKGYVALLLVKSQHEMLKHAGVGTLISSLRSRYWVISVRTIAKRVVKQCVTCRRYDARPMNQVTAPLPQDRVTQSPPFSVTGIDHAGPLYCSDTGEKKLYIVLFTCAVTRALHLGLVNSLSVEDFIMAFRRFVARRALPNIIYSDNAKTFTAANSLLQTHFGKEIVHWKHICPLSPNWGGWWERLVRSVKSSLKKSLGRQTVTKVELETILPEIEACVNSRPLMYIAEKGKVLTPSHFLIGRATPFNATELSNFEQVTNLSAREEFEESLTEQFWQVWRSEYLRNLPPLTIKSKKSNNSLELDSVVLIRDDKRPRMWWALGRVVKLYDGIDGKVRAVQLKTEKGLITRSINHICLLEDSSRDPMAVDTCIEQLPCHPPTPQDKELVHSEQAEGNTGQNVPKKHGPIVTRVGRCVKPRQIVDV